MLRIKRSVQAQFNTEACYIAAQMASKEGEVEQAEAENEMDVNPMAAMEREATSHGCVEPLWVGMKTPSSSYNAGVRRANVA